METDLTKIPARIKYYLLDWKENSMKDLIYLKNKIGNYDNH